MKTSSLLFSANQLKQSLSGSASAFILAASFLCLFPNIAAAVDKNVPAEDKGDKSCVVIVHVDVMPPFSEPGLKLLQDYRHASKEDIGEKRIEILQQAGRPNHFTMIEEWSDQNAYENHLSLQHSRDFRSALQPMLGSPFMSAFIIQRPDYKGSLLLFFILRQSASAL